MSFDTHGRDGLHQCRGCCAQLTVTVGTIFEDSQVPLHKWLLVIHLMCSSSSKKGVSALQIHRNLELGLTEPRAACEDKSVKLVQKSFTDEYRQYGCQRKRD